MKFTEVLEDAIIKTAAELYESRFYPGHEHWQDLNEFADIAYLTGDEKLKKAIKAKMKSFQLSDPELYEKVMQPFRTDRALLRYYLMTGDNKAIREVIKQNKYQARKMRAMKRSTGFFKHLLPATLLGRVGDIISKIV